MVGGAMMTWTERRAALIEQAAVTPGYGTPRLPSDQHIGRVLMRPLRTPNMRWPAGLYLAGSPTTGTIDHHLAAVHRKATLRLPK